MEDKFHNPRFREGDCFCTRDGKFGEIGGHFWSSRDEETGELTFHAELPDVTRHFLCDFDVCILVVAWNFWALGHRMSVWPSGLLGDHKAREFIGHGIEAWLQERGKLEFAEGLRREDFTDGDDE